MKQLQKVFTHDFARQHGLLSLQAQNAQQALLGEWWVMSFYCNLVSEIYKWHPCKKQDCYCCQDCYCMFTF